MKLRSHVTSRAVEFLPRRFFFLALCEPSRVTLPTLSSSSSLSTTASARRQRSFPTTPGVRYVSLDDQLLALESRVSCARSELHDTVFFCDFLSSFLPSDADSDRSTTSTRDRSSRNESSQAPAAPQVYYFCLREASVSTETRVIHLICRWRLLHLRLSPLEALAPFEHRRFLFPAMTTPLTASRSPLPRRAHVNLCVSLEGIAKGLRTDQLDTAAVAQSSLDELRHLVSRQEATHETRASGALLWPSKRLAVVAALPLNSASPVQQPSQADVSITTEATESGSTPSLASERSLQTREFATQELIAMLKQHHVTVVLRLHRQPHDDDTHFAANGIELVDLAAPPVEPVPPPLTTPVARESNGLGRFLRACEATLTAMDSDGVVAVVHADAGSGTAIAVVGCYLMKHLTFTSREAFGWLHACGFGDFGLAHSHQLVLDCLQSGMWRDGAEFRRLASEDDETSVSHLTRSALLRSAAGPLPISIGNISLGRHSLFGAKAAATTTADKRAHKPSTSREPSASAVRPPARDLVDSSLAGAAQLQRRPVTQGSSGRRLRVRNGESVHVRTDFAQMHKFLHQTGSVGSLSTPRSSGARVGSRDPNPM